MVREEGKGYHVMHHVVHHVMNCFGQYDEICDGRNSGLNIRAKLLGITLEICHKCHRDDLVWFVLVD